MREIGEGQFGKVLLMKAKVIADFDKYCHLFIHVPNRIFVAYKDQFLLQ